MLSQRELNKLTDAINTAFDKLGHNGQSIKSKNNQDSYVWDMHVSKLLETRAKKRREDALKAAILAGIAPDVELEPQNIGERVLFTGEAMSLTLKVVSRGSGVDIKEFSTLLAKKGVSAKIINECLVGATKAASKIHTFTAIPIVE